MCVNYCGRKVHSDLEEDRRFASDSLVTWRDAVGYICRRWVHARTRWIVLSTMREGTGVHDEALHPQNRNNFEADKRSVVSTRWLCPFPAGSK